MLRSERALTRHGGSLSNYWCYNPGALERAKLYKAEHPICGRSKGEHEARVIHPIVVEDTVFEPWKEREYQLEVLKDECFLDECGDHFNILQPIP
jgi:hypothetical protein